MSKRLELTWPGKGAAPKLEPRVLVEDRDIGHGLLVDQRLHPDGSDNALIFGDNLLALKALERGFSGRIRCVFIDPPYNTQSAFAQYDDGLEHSLWLSLMKHRLEMIHRLLADDGSLWITIDDNEVHYLKVMCDEIFGRTNFVSNIVWERKASPQANAVWVSDLHDHVLVYAKNKATWRPNLLERTAEADSRYSNPDNDPRGPWTSGPCTISLTAGARGKQFAQTGHDPNQYTITTPGGRKVNPPGGTTWRYSQNKFGELVEDNRIWFGEKGKNVPRIKRFLSEVQQGIVPGTMWTRKDVGDYPEAKKEVVAFNDQDTFATPKPERLLQRILHLATKPGDWVLDSFAGSGTTGAVAHKMGRRWVMVELGEHCHTHIIPRMQKIIDGEDEGGITKAVGWRGGGGFRYFRLAPSLLKKDPFGNWVINPEYNPEMLAEAVCKLEGFTYAPSQDRFWLHGHSTEDDYIYVTTQHLGDAELARLEEELPEGKHLLVCCKAFRSKDVDRYERLRVKKIPKMVLHKCEWDRDDYSLNIQEPKKELAKEEAQPTLEAYQ